MLFPLTELEFHRAAGRKSTYAIRALLAGVLVTGILAFGFMLQFIAPSQFAQDPAELAASLFVSVLRNAEFAIVFLVAPMLTAGAIAQERRDGTLGFLLLANYNPRDVFLAKFSSALIQSYLLLLSLLPVAAIGSLLGGVSVSDMLTSAVLMGTWAAAACALGLYCSCLAPTGAEAFLFTLVGLAVINFAAGLLDMAMGSSFRLASMTSPYTNTSLQFVGWEQSAVLGLLVAVVASIAALKRLRAYVRPKPIKRRVQTRFDLRLARWIPAGPAGALFDASAPGFSVHQWPMLRRLAMVAGIIPLMQLPYAGGLALPALICYDIASSIAEARQSGALDSLLLTPGDDRAMARSIYRICLRRAVIFGLALAALYAFYMFRYPSGFYVVGVVTSSVPFLLLCVAAGCWASTLPFRPAVQAAIAVISLRVVGSASSYGLRVLISSSVARVFAWVSWMMGFYYIVNGIVSLIIALYLYRWFRRRLATTWRNGYRKPFLPTRKAA